MAELLKDGSIRMRNGRILWGRDVVQIIDVCELNELLVPPPKVVGGFQGFGGGGRGSKGDTGPAGLQGPPGIISLIQNQGFNLPLENTLNFIGESVSVVDDPGNGRLNITIDDLYAATRIVSSDPAHGTDTSIADALTNLPAQGGKIFVKDPQVVSATIVSPLKDVVIEFAAGATITTTGLGANPLFLLPDGLASDTEFILSNPQVIGEDVAGQFFMAVADSNSLWHPVIYTPDITLFRNIFDIRAGDLAYLTPVVIDVWGGRLVPPGVGTGVLAQSPSPAGTYEFGMAIRLHNVVMVDFTDPTLGFGGMDFDGELIMEAGTLILNGLNRFTGMDAYTGANIFGGTGPITDTLQAIGNNFFTSLRFSDITLGKITLHLGPDGFFAKISDMTIYFGGRIILESGNAELRGVETDEDFGFTEAVPAIIDILAAAHQCLISGRLTDVGATVAIIRIATQKTRIDACNFEALGLANTVLEVGAADFTLGVGNIGVSSGGGLVLIGANSRITIGDYNFA